MIYQITYTKDGSGRNRKVARPVKDRQELMALRAENLAHLAKAREGSDADKRELVQLAYNLGHIVGKIAGAKSIGSYFFYDVDCYDKGESPKIRDMILGKKDEIGLMMLEQSASGGWHLVCRRERGKTILENIVRVSMLLHLEMDTGTKDLQRVVFSTSGAPEDLVYLDDALFEEPMSKEECEKEYEVLKERTKKGLEEVPKGAKKADKHYRPWEEAGSPPESGGVRRGLNEGSDSVVQTTPTPPNSGGEGCADKASERSWFIAEGVMKEKGLDRSDFVDEGGRHTAVKIFLSGATQLLTKGETNGVLKVLMPDHWQDENIQQLVNDFYQNYTNPNQRLLKYQEELFTQSRRLSAADLSHPQGMLGEAPPELPKKLPKLISLLTSRTPDVYKAAVAHAVFPALGSHLCGVSFTYTDNVDHEATLMNCLMAPTGSGKGCIDEPIAHIMADIKRRDEENERREDEWKKDCQKKGANKDKMVRPEGLVIQIIDPDMTKPS